jgi:hypothetical protein
MFIHASMPQRLFSDISGAVQCFPKVVAADRNASQSTVPGFFLL